MAGEIKTPDPAVPAPGDASPSGAASTTQTGGTGQTPPPSPAPAAIAAAPSPLSRDELIALFREQAGPMVRDQLVKAFPELAQALEQTLQPKFATHEAISTEAQRASDKRFAKLMKELAPEMRGIDKAVKAGQITEEGARNLKQDMLLEAAAKLAEDEPPEQAATSSQPAAAASGSQLATPPPAAASPFAAKPAPSPKDDAKTAAEELLTRNGLSWNDVRAELDAYQAQHPEGMPLAEFTALVADKATARKSADLKTQMMREYEARALEVREADRAGATTPPPGGDSVDKRKELQKKYKNTGRVEDYLAAVEE